MEADEQRVWGHEWGELIKKKKGVSVEQIHLEKRTEQKCSPKTFLGQSSFICQQLSLTLTQGCKIMVLCLFHSPPPPRCSNGPLKRPGNIVFSQSTLTVLLMAGTGNQTSAVLHLCVLMILPTLTVRSQPGSCAREKLWGKFMNFSILILFFCIEYSLNHPLSSYRGLQNQTTSSEVYNLSIERQQL